MKDKNIEQKRKCDNTYRGLNLIELIYASYHRRAYIRAGELNSYDEKVYCVDSDKYAFYRHKATSTEKRKIVESILGDADRDEDTDWRGGVRIVYFRDIVKNHEKVLIRALEEEPLAEYSMWERWCIVDNDTILNPEQSEKLIAKIIIRTDETLREEDEYLNVLLAPRIC